MEMRIAMAAAWVVALGAHPAASAQAVVETFDSLAAQTIEQGYPLLLEHFHVEIPGLSSAEIRAVPEGDAIASGMALGTPAGHSGASLFLYFKKPWQRVDITFVVPPSELNYQTVAFLYGNAEKPYAFSMWHTTTGHRVRVSLSQPEGTPFYSLFLRLQEGALVDNVELR